jgi:IclR family transcriptional regulator, KDG regulon repressor
MLFVSPESSAMNQPTTRTVERALDILLCFRPEEPGLTLTQISERVDMHKSTVHRLLATLENKHFIQHAESDGTYHLGLRLVELGFTVLKGNDIHRQALPYMQRLSAECRETVDLAILDGGQVVYLQVVESPQRMKFAAAPGQRLPVLGTATGKGFLAFLPSDQTEAILKQGMAKYTESTKISLASLRKELLVVRERGFATSQQEYEDGVNAVAAPILDGNMHPVASMAIVGPAFRLPQERLQVLGKLVRETADAIARDLGLTLKMS